MVQSLHYRVISRCLSLLLIGTNSSCTYVSSTRRSDDSWATSQLKADPSASCLRAIKAIPGCPDNGDCPDAVYIAGMCFQRGLGQTAQDHARGVELLDAAAACGVEPAKAELRSLSLPVPDSKISLGYALFAPSTSEKQMCGLKDSATAFALLGTIAVTPVLLCAGVVFAAGVVVLAPPYCAFKWAFSETSCSEDLHKRKEEVDAANRH